LIGGGGAGGGSKNRILGNYPNPLIRFLESAHLLKTKQFDSDLLIQDWYVTCDDVVKHESWKILNWNTVSSLDEAR